MATSTIFNFSFNNSEIVDSTGQWYNATTGTPTTEFIEHDGNTALLQRAYIAGTAYTRDINPVFFQSRDPTFTAHTYTIELQLYPLRDPGGANFGPESGPVLDFNPDADDEEGWVRLSTGQHGSSSNTFYWREYGLGPDGAGIPFLTVTTADGTYNRWYSIRIERVDDGTNTGATIKIYVDGTLVVNETLTHPQDARRGRIGNSIRYTYRRSSIDPQGAGAAIDNFKLTAGIAPSSVVDVSLANLQRNNANLLSFIKGKVPTVNDGTLTIQKNGVNVQTFTANASTNATANITVPTKTSDLTNDSGFITSDDTKIPLAGSNQISGSLIPATTDAYDLGGASYQWNNAYIKSLTIDGTQFLPSDYMTLNTIQTVTSAKYYTNYQDINGYRLRIKSPAQEKGVIPASNLWNGFVFCDKNNETMFSIEQGMIANGVIQLNFSGRANDNSTTYTTFLRYVNTSDLTTNSVNVIDLMPFGNGTRKLGDTNAKWKSFNGLNPGALSLWSNNYISLDTTNFDVTSTTIGTFTPTVDGWAILVIGQKNKPFGIWLIGGTIRESFYSVKNDGDYFIFALIPVRANVNMTIYCTADDIDSTRNVSWLRLSPCQGNV